MNPIPFLPTTQKPAFVRFRYLQENGIVNDRMALARAIERYGFPQAVALGANTLAWDLAAVDAWIAARPRVTPKTGEKKPAASECEVV